MSRSLLKIFQRSLSTVSMKVNRPADLSRERLMLSQDKF